MESIEFSEEELQHILDCVVFQGCPDANFTDSDSEERKTLFTTILEKFAEAEKKTSEDLYICDGKLCDEYTANLAIDLGISELRR